MPDSPPKTVLFIGAHPDDETVLAGATLALLAERGHIVQVICATRGEGGEIGEPPVVADRTALGSAREQELRCACQALGVSQLTLLDYVDPAVGPEDDLYPFTDDFDGFVAQLRDLLLASAPAIVLTHGTDGEYGHPAHQFVHQAVLEAAIQALPTTSVVYSVAASVPGEEDYLWNSSDPADLQLQLGPWAEKKFQATLCHRSQHALFKRALEADELRQTMRHETLRRQWPEAARPVDDVFSRILLAAGARRLPAQQPDTP